MSTNYKQKAFRNEHNKLPLQLVPDVTEFKRVKYSLKMALRMVNANFSQFQVWQFNQPGILSEKDNDRTTVECWVRADDQQKEAITKAQAMLFLANDPKIFTVGSIINNASELPIDTPLTFFLFRV
jgi:hypothetical protein